MFKVIKQTETQSFPEQVQFTRLVRRSVYDKKGQRVSTYTVAIKNNCIQANYDDLNQAMAHYKKLVGND